MSDEALLRIVLAGIAICVVAVFAWRAVDRRDDPPPPPPGWPPRL
jgi:hypothetical protein